LPYWEQNYARFLPDGKVRRSLLEYIFTEDKSGLLSEISTVLKYPSDNLAKSEVIEEQTLINEDEFISATVWTSPIDQKVKIIKYNESVTHGDVKEITFYFVDDVYCFIRYKVTDSVEGMYSEAETYYVGVDDKIYKMVDGSTQAHYDDTLVELKNNILNKFRAGRQEPTIQIERATDELISRFGSLYDYTDTENSGERLLLWTDIALKEFHFISVNYYPESDSWVAEDQLYSINEWQPEKALFLNTYISEGIPTRGIAFRGENNRMRFFAIRESGMTGGVYQLREIPVSGFM
jgi:hypothetical protein